VPTIGDSYVRGVIDAMKDGKEPLDGGSRALETLALTQALPDAPGFVISMLASALFGDAVDIHGPGRFSGVRIYRIKQDRNGDLTLDHRDAKGDHYSAFNRQAFAQLNDVEFRKRAVATVLSRGGTDDEAQTFWALTHLGVDTERALAFVVEHGADAALIAEARRR
jgi:hypothetical protein